MNGFTAVVCIAFLSLGARADIYLHNLAGSNNRNRERNENRNNNNRIFDSQNNAKGGYPWRGDRTLKGKADPLVLYEGSIVNMEWTVQHSCGTNPNAHCSVILQYACEDSIPNLRDGYPTGSLQPVPNNDNNFQQATFTRNNGDGTTQIDPSTATDVEFGMHENLAYYTDQCNNRLRNHGLYTADQKLGGDAAKFTRQNPNGGRSGFECPEERDYYPYWHPSPWRDVAVLTSNASFCPYYQANSQNTATTYYCSMSEANRQNAPSQLRPITATACAQYQGTWTAVAPWNIDQPTCTIHDFSRDNHLGNVLNSVNDGQPEAANYNWQIPFVSQTLTRPNYPFDAKAQPPTTSPSISMNSAASDAATNGGLQCIARIRYNVSTNDYPSMKGMDGSGEYFDSTFNCPRVSTSTISNSATNPNAIDTANTGLADQSLGCGSVLDDGNRPRYNRPYVQMFTDQSTPLLSIAMNTDQLGRTFQDRTYAFLIKPRPSGVPAGATIWNLNNRGKRGNIVQSYPAVEYDFAPKILNVNKNDYIHIQFHGSDYNTNRNPNNAEGWQYSDRFNLVQTQEPNTQIPMKASESTLFPDEATAKLYALLGQQKLVDASGNLICKPFLAGQANEDESPNNCGKLNAAPAHMDFGLTSALAINRGTYYYISTRNNNFSNRSQKGILNISGLSTAEIIGITIGVVGFVGLSAAGAIFAVRRGIIKIPEKWSFATRATNLNKI